MSDPARRSNRWLSTVEAAHEIGVSDWWIRDRIDQGLLPANVISTGSRRVYRIAREDWERFRARYVGLATDPRFEGRGR
ncbi:MAG TPA: hypothetical protein VKR30_01115 [Candidatus Limnocylindrales bacterium]|nr:hypothetical protein [Candidatus Limnocylindrales bacterium]